MKESRIHCKEWRGSDLMAVNNVYRRNGIWGIATDSGCETGRFTVQNGQFRPPKRPVSQPKTALIVSGLEIRRLQCVLKYDDMSVRSVKYLYKIAVSGTSTQCKMNLVWAVCLEILRMFIWQLDIMHRGKSPCKSHANPICDKVNLRLKCLMTCFPAI